MQENTIEIPPEELIIIKKGDKEISLNPFEAQKMALQILIKVDAKGLMLPSSTEEIEQLLP